MFGAPLLPHLLANDPYTCSLTWAGLGGSLGHDILKTGHAFEALFEGLAGSDNGRQRMIVESLVHDSLVVGGWVTPGRVGKVHEDCVVVQRAEMVDKRRIAPDRLVEERLLRC